MQFIKRIVFCLSVFIAFKVSAADPHVALLKMDMEILPGTSEYLRRGITESHAQGAKIVVVELDTPGGMLLSSQEMVKTLFDAPLPVVVYVSPSGATATSAGVFITLAAHIAAMAPGTTIGAAHPVAGDGKDIEGDMRAKAENMTIAMIKSISEQRKRNIEWAESSVKTSDSITDKVAFEKKVIDVAAPNIPLLLKELKGTEVKIGETTVTLEDYSSLPILTVMPSLKERTINTFANPSVAALLWLGATTGLGIELYNPGLILPGVVGVICLILALAVMQVIPITQSGILLLILGAALIGAEMFVPSGVLAIGGIISMVIGLIYFVDVSKAPDISIDMVPIISTAVTTGLLMMLLVRAIVKTHRSTPVTGIDGLVGQIGQVQDADTVFVNGELWKAVADGGSKLVSGDKVRILGIMQGLTAKVERVNEG